MHRRTAIAGLALVTALGLTGCAASDVRPATGGAGQPSTTAVVEAASVELADAQAKLLTSTARVRMEMAGTMTGTGVVDPARGISSMTMTMGAAGQGMTVEVRKIGNDLYTKLGGEMAALTKGRWTRIDLSKAGNGALATAGDPKFAADLLKTSASVKRTGEHTFAGTIDVTKASAGFGGDKEVATLGPAAKAVPFTAKTDAEGRLIEMTTDMSGIDKESGVMKVTYSGFGTPVSVQAPPKSQVMEMPDSLKGVLG